jgi:uncharacterized membrane protein YagU involved in acid resistance
MLRPNTGKAILAGFIATLAMTFLGMMGPSMGMPKMDVAAMLGMVFNNMQPVQEGSNLWWAGMVWHFVNGAVIFPLIYEFILYPYMPGPDTVKGLTWGLILFILAQIAVIPLMGMGVFSANAPNAGMMVTGSLIGHLVYGALLGAIAGHETAPTTTDRLGHA